MQLINSCLIFYVTLEYVMLSNILLISLGVLTSKEIERELYTPSVVSMLKNKFLN